MILYYLVLEIRKYKVKEVIKKFYIKIIYFQRYGYSNLYQIGLKIILATYIYQKPLFSIVCRIFLYLIQSDYMQIFN